MSLTRHIVRFRDASIQLGTYALCLPKGAVMRKLICSKQREGISEGALRHLCSLSSALRGSAFRSPARFLSQ